MSKTKTYWMALYLRRPGEFGQERRDMQVRIDELLRLIVHVILRLLSLGDPAVEAMKYFTSIGNPL
jgi:hypothetical protein